MPTYGPPALTLVRGSGATVWDADGTAYTDFLAGLAVSSVGHAHPRVVAAVTRQLETLGHVSNLYLNRPSLELADRLVELAGVEGTVFFGNSGAEANEAALKLARRVRPGGGFVAAEGGFHGRTLGALSVTGQPAKRAPFEPLLPGVTFVPYGDASIPPGTAALILEPVQGEGGVVPAPAGYLAAARAACDAAGALLVLDEVQTGIGRTGAWFAWQHEGVVPDVMTLAKGLAGGLPIGACVAFGAAADAFRPGDHGSTFGGNPVVCAAALAVLDVIEQEGLLDRATKLGERLATGLAALPGVAEVRGAGLLLGVVLEQPAAQAVEATLRDAGFLVNAIGDTVIRLAPPLVVSERQIDALVPAFAAALGSARVAAGDPQPSRRLPAGDPRPAAGLAAGDPQPGSGCRLRRIGSRHAPQAGQGRTGRPGGRGRRPGGDDPGRLDRRREPAARAAGPGRPNRQRHLREELRGLPRRARRRGLALDPRFGVHAGRPAGRPHVRPAGREGRPRPAARGHARVEVPDHRGADPPGGGVHADPVRPVAGPERRGRRMTRVLVVEDDPSVRGLLHTLLTGEGYEVTTASDGLAGLVKASSDQPALILLDLMMPDLGGIRVLEELRSDPRLAGVPVVVVTGKLDAVPPLRDLLGEHNVFAKPFGVTELLNRVAEITGSS